MAKIMKDTAQEQALLEVADLLQQLKILDNSTKKSRIFAELYLSCWRWKNAAPSNFRKLSG